MANQIDQVFKKFEVPEPTILRTEKFIGVLRSKAVLSKDIHVLDLGCGLGCTGSSIINEVKTVTFLDVTEKSKKSVSDIMTELKTTNYEYFDQPIEQYHGEKFDLAIASLSFHHIDDYLSVIKILPSHLNENANVIVLEIIDDGIPRPNVPHRGFVPEKFCQEFLNNGFKSAEWENFGQIDIHGTPHDLFIMIAKI